MGIHKERPETVHRVHLGKVAKDNDYGFRAFQFGHVVVKFRRGKAEVAPYLDTDLKPITEYTEVHIALEVGTGRGRSPYLWAHGPEYFEKAAAWFPAHADMLREFADIVRNNWRTGTCAGTTEQMECLRKPEHAAELEASRDHYGTACEILKREGLYEVGEWRGPSNTGEPRPYKYGSAWLCASVPAEVEARILALVGKDA